MGSLSPPLLHARGLEKSFPSPTGRLQVLSGAELEVYAGDRIAIVGPSGSGKSTLLHILGGLETYDAGVILWEGRQLSRAVEDLALWRRVNVGFVFQFYHLIPELCVWENVALPLLLNGVKKAKAKEAVYSALSEVGLGDLGERQVEFLSGGEMQRVAILRAVIHRPKLVFADEPTGNLDPHIQRQVLDFMLNRLKESGSALVMVTHDFDLAKEMDKVFLLSDGKLHPYMVESKK